MRNLKVRVYVACSSRATRGLRHMLVLSLILGGAASSWAASAPNAFQQFLDRYRLETSEGALVDYRAVTEDDKLALRGYVEHLQAQSPSAWTDAAAQAFWVNLYNSRMILLVLDAGIPNSVKDIKPDVGAWLAGGPWKLDVVTVEGRSLSFDDIEHGILRTQWREPRIHFVLNCASIGCPDLPAQVLTSAAFDAQLTAAASRFINSEKGVKLEAGRLYISRIFDWFGEDFGPTELARLRYINSFRTQPLPLKGVDVRYRYDWSLNAPQAAR